jgi:hypothetical protein
MITDHDLEILRAAANTANAIGDHTLSARIEALRDKLKEERETYYPELIESVSLGHQRVG